MAKRSKENITLGSGKIYIVEHTGEIPTHTEICKPENLLGHTKGGAELEPLRIYTEEEGYLVDKSPTTNNIDRYEYEIRHFVDCVRTGRKPTSSLDDAVTIQKILCGIYESAKTHREVEL